MNSLKKHFSNSVTSSKPAIMRRPEAWDQTFNMYATSSPLNYGLNSHPRIGTEDSRTSKTSRSTHPTPIPFSLQTFIEHPLSVRTFSRH